VFGSLFAPVTAITVFVAVFALALWRGVHIGLLMFAAACLVGTGVAGMALRDVIGGFPVGILILVAGVTYFFGIAQVNGTVDRVVAVLLTRSRGRTMVPVAFFGLAGVTAAMGSPQAGLATGPVGMFTARRARVDPVLMAIAINSGICTGSMAPTSLFGVITYGVARDAGIDVSRVQLLVVAALANLLLLGLAGLVFSRSAPPAASTDVARAPHREPAEARPSLAQRATLVCLVGLVPGIIAATLAGAEVDVGVTLLSLGVVLALLDPAVGTRALARVDWSTAMVVCGIVTYVGVLQHLDAVNLLGRQALTIGTPMLAAVLICMVAALVSAFASTTAVLAALVPMAVPLASTGSIPGWALITALGVCATIVDSSPFSNTGATLVASAPEEARPRLRRLLLRWSLALVVGGPVVLVPLLVLLFS
jgi:di/tricarboxylate transporter